MSDFVIGEKVIYRYDTYDSHAKKFHPVQTIARVIEIGPHGIKIETEKGKNDYDLWVGALCLDMLERIGTNSENVLLFRKKD